MFKKTMPWGVSEHPVFDDRLAGIAASWWTDRFLIADRREEFREALVRELLKQEPKERTSPAMSVYSDYDPQDALLEAVRAIGIECRGHGFSSEGLFPMKTGITLSRKGELWAKEGYGKQPYRIDAPDTGRDKNGGV
jgi:hypothetical protein